MSAVCARVLGQGQMSGSPLTHVGSGVVETSEPWIRAGKVSQARGAGTFILLVPSPWVGSGCRGGEWLPSGLHLWETQPSEALTG